MLKHWHVGSRNFSSLEEARAHAVEKAEAEIGAEVPVYEAVEAWRISLPKAESVPLGPPATRTEQSK